MKYADKLKDPRWQRKRLEIFQRDGWKCVRCDCGTKTLHVHHKEYQAGAEPWEYEDSVLETLCEDCHGKEHGKAKSVAVTSGVDAVKIKVQITRLRALLLNTYGPATDLVEQRIEELQKQIYDPR
jgi:5-methylcytosine-specific restriction endonuclease McrA